jgi:hypothetical protein
MMKRCTCLIVLLVMVIFSCKSEPSTEPGPPNVPPPSKSVKSVDSTERPATDERGDSKTASFLGLDTARTIFPQEWQGYVLDGIKEKNKSDVWVEYSATYKGASGKVKAVLNEHLPGIDPAWTALFATLEKYKFDGHEAAFQDKKDKRTYMVIVQPRFRVDVKSRELSSDALRTLAQKFPYAAVGRLGN